MLLATPYYFQESTRHSAIIKAKKFKNRGNKPGALEACRRLEEAGMGKLVELGKSRGTAMVIIIITCMRCILISSNSLAQPISGIPY